MILPPISQVGWASASSRVTSSRSVRPRNGPPEAVSTRRSTVPGGSPRISWCSAECSESTGISCAPVASASAVTSSPPTTSDSLLARATSMPSVRATTVGPSPAEPTIALRTRSAPESRSARAPPPPRSARPRSSPLCGPPRRHRGWRRRPPDAVLLGLGERTRSQLSLAARPASSRSSQASITVERLRADRPRGPEDQDSLHRPQCRGEAEAAMKACWRPPGVPGGLSRGRRPRGSSRRRS